MGRALPLPLNRLAERESLPAINPCLPVELDLTQRVGIGKLGPIS